MVLAPSADEDQNASISTELDYKLVALLEKLGVADCVEGLQSMFVTNVALLHKLIAEGFDEKDCAEIGIVGASRTALLEWHERTYVPPEAETYADDDSAAASVDSAWAPQPEPDAVIYTGDAETQSTSTTTVTNIKDIQVEGRMISSTNTTKRGAADEEEETIELLTCLERFGRLEQLDGDSKYYCPKCKDFMAGTKQVGVWQPPPVLVLQLKRFKHQQRLGSSAFSAKKVQTLVNFSADELLDLTPFVLAPPPGAEDGEGQPAPEAETPPAKPAAMAEADVSIVEAIEGMGFSENAAKRAALATGNTGAAEAVEWCFAHNEDPDFNLPLEAEETEAQPEEGAEEEEEESDPTRHLYELFAVANHTGGTGGGHYCKTHRHSSFLSVIYYTV
jgi:uncharacterized UBP type Zn finger protein